MANNLDTCLLLIADFLAQKLTHSQFRSLYFSTFKAGLGEISEEQHQLFNEMFTDLDMSEPDDELRSKLLEQHPGLYLDESKLREKAKLIHAKLIRLRQ
jgi:hypothetical protein